MPFTCNVVFSEAHLGGTPPEDAEFERYSVEVGTMLAPGDPICVLRSGDRTFVVRSRFRAQLRNTPRASGDSLSAEDLLAALAADGEDIPSGFRYCTLREEPGP